jgi:hypothetical protein
MLAFLIKVLLGARSRLKSRASLVAENLVLRQQVNVLSRKARSRVRLRNIDRLILVWLYRCFPAILNAITVVFSQNLIRAREPEFSRGRDGWRASVSTVLSTLIQSSEARVANERGRGDARASCGGLRIDTVT